MATKKQPNVELIARGRTQTFGFDHAQRLLKMKNNGGWVLPEDSPFNLDDNNAIITKHSKRTYQKSSKD